jgi:inhibitor of cysteine peptidase
MTKYFANAAALLICAAMIARIVPTSAAAAEPVAATEAQNGKDIVVDKGASLVIVLESNPSTGYGWRVGKNNSAIMELVGPPRFHPAAHQMPGAPGHQLFTFHALAIGRDAIELEYLRPWEKGVASVKTFSVVVTVK